MYEESQAGPIDTRAWLVERLAVTVTCCWCEWLETTWPVVFEDAAFVVLAPGAERCTRNSLTLVPRAHAPLLTELSAHDMADVLAGLSRLSLAVRRACGLHRVEIQTHPADVSGRGGHVHFHPVLTGRLHDDVMGESGEREVDEKIVLAIADSMAHAGVRLGLDEPI